VIRSARGTIVVEILDGEEGVAPGQACVFYEGDGAGARVLGGGTIALTNKAKNTSADAAAMQPATAIA
jgi:tRNA-specific 2-thiouridylase